MLKACGDSTFRLGLGDEISPLVHGRVLRYKKELDSLKLDGIVEIVPAYNSLSIQYDPLVLDIERLKEILKNLSENEIEDQNQAPGRLVRVPVCYDLGLDLDRVASHTGLDPKEIIRLHSESTYLVYMLGFMAGFAYLGGLDERLFTPRLDSPRARIEAGSVGLADKQTGIYPLASPAGWNILGLTPLKLYDAHRREPILLRAGDRINFYAISKEEFDFLKDQVKRGLYKPEIEDSIKENEARAPSFSTVAKESQNDLKLMQDIKPPGIKVLKAGVFTSIQDLGRLGLASQGVPQCGVMDRYSTSLLNLLLKNDKNAAVIEMNLLGADYEFLVPTFFAVGGALSDSYLNDEAIKPYCVYEARLGDRLSIGRFITGSRAYLAVSGGVATRQALGSRSTDTRLKLGGLGRKLEAGDLLPIGAVDSRLANLPKRHLKNWLLEENLNRPLRVILGPQADNFSREAIEDFLSSSYVISPRSDRMGLRLEGRAIKHKGAADIITDGLAFGSIQVPKDGQPLILMADRQTSGGYPKIACVISSDLPRLAQLPVNSQVRFEAIELEAAWDILRREAAFLRRLSMAL